MGEASLGRELPTPSKAPMPAHECRVCQFLPTGMASQLVQGVTVARHPRAQGGALEPEATPPRW